MNFRYTLLATLGLACSWSALLAADDPAFLNQITQEIAKLQAEKRARTGVQRKVASTLLAADRVRKVGRASEALPDLESDADVDVAGAVLMDLKATVSPQLLAEIRRLGGAVEYSHAGLKSVRARIPLAALDSLAARGDVRSIKPAALCKTNAGKLGSEGDIAHRANLARTTFGATGRGVKVGVLSDSVDHLARSQSGAELNRVNILGEESGLGSRFSGEGTAMLEIVHDLAPDAELFFATAFRSDASFAENIRDLAAAGCSIIIDDVGYFNEPPFQDGIIAQAVRDVAEQGVLYFSAAGNSGNENDLTSGTWEGDFKAGEDRGPRIGTLHDFGGGVTGNKVDSSGIANLFWANPMGGATDDYDIYIANSRGRIVRSSNDTQDGDDDPYETVRVRRGERVIIVQFSGESRFLYLDTLGAPLAISTPGNIRGHAAVDTPNAFGVAATSARRAIGPFVGGVTNPVERFSSDGFRRMFFLPDGTPITPGDFTSTGGKILAKPDITAADGVSTSVPGFNPFFGTSAAAPHAGAIAALLRSFKPNLTGADIRAALESTALDIEATGLDQDAGAGILNAEAALQSVAGLLNVDPVVTLSQGVVTYTENGSPVLIDPAGTIVDSDSTHFSGGSLTVAITANQVEGDRLQVVSKGFDAGQIGVNGNSLFLGGELIGALSGPVPLVITFSSSAVTPAVATAVLRQVAFDSTSERPTNSNRTVRFTLNDGNGGSGLDNRTVDVLSVNDAPTFTKGPDVVIRDDTTTQSIAPWATNISPGPGEESVQDVTFQVTHDNNALFDKDPSISPNGTLSFRLNSGSSDFATVTVTLQDTAGNENGGTSSSASETFRIYRNPANLPPSFTAGPDIVVGSNSAPFTFPSWATGISAGAGEAQAVDFIVMVDDATLFSAGPAISPNGTLTFAPAANRTGVANVTVQAHDNGGGLNTSPAQVFAITIASFAEEIGVYNGLVAPADSTQREFARFGLLRAVVSRKGALSATLVLGGGSYRVKGDVAPDGTVTFGRAGAATMTLQRRGQAPLTLGLALDTSGGSDVLTGTISNGATAFALVTADRATPPSVSLARKYTAAFPARSPAQLGLATTLTPQGDGIAVGSVQTGGALRFIGRLADGSRIGFSSALSRANSFPLHILTDRKHGSLSGQVVFRDVAGTSDFDASDLAWFKPASSRRKVYPSGWPTGISTDLVGSALTVTPGQPILPGLPAASTAGNAEVIFSGIGSGTILEKTLSIDPRSRVRVIGRDDDRLRIRISSRSGAFAARLKDPAGRNRVGGLGVVLQKQGLGTGFFVENKESGGILILPKNL